MDDEAYEATISERAEAFTRALDGAGRVAVYRPNALLEWDVETFSPEAVRRAMGNRREALPAPDKEG